MYKSTLSISSGDRNPGVREQPTDRVVSSYAIDLDFEYGVIENSFRRGDWEKFTARLSEVLCVLSYGVKVFTKSFEERGIRSIVFAASRSENRRAQGVALAFIEKSPFRDEFYESGLPDVFTENQWVFAKLLLYYSKRSVETRDELFAKYYGSMSYTLAIPAFSPFPFSEGQMRTILESVMRERLSEDTFTALGLVCENQYFTGIVDELKMGQALVDVFNDNEEIDEDVIRLLPFLVPIPSIKVNMELLQSSIMDQSDSVRSSGFRALIAALSSRPELKEFLSEEFFLNLEMHVEEGTYADKMLAVELTGII